MFHEQLGKIACFPIPSTEKFLVFKGDWTISDNMIGNSAQWRWKWMGIALKIEQLATQLQCCTILPLRSHCGLLFILLLNWEIHKRAIDATVAHLCYWFAQHKISVQYCLICVTRKICQYEGLYINNGNWLLNK